MSPTRSERPLSVRAEAARIVERIVAGHGTVEEAMAATVPAADSRDQALLRALVAGALRWHHRLEWIVSALTADRDGRIDPLVAAVVRIGLLQLTELRIPDHAAVAATVDATGELGRGRARGFVNALLRRFLREQGLFTDADDPRYRYSHPAWFVAAVTADWPDQYWALLDANNAPAPMWLRVNLTRTTRDAYRQRLAGAGLAANIAPESPAALKLAAPCRAAALPGFAEGLVSVQDLAPQCAAALLDLAPGQRVLDACAAPGGKTAHMLETCPGLAAVVALDRNAGRLDRVRTELDRLGLTAELVLADATQTAAWWDGRLFDRILLDAPCTATGVIRRHPDIKLRRSPADIEHATAQQDVLLAALWPLLAPGGKLLYATCSVLDAENSERIAAFLAEQPDAVCEPIGTSTHFRVRPGAADMDGFYYACLGRLRGRSASL